METTGFPLRSQLWPSKDEGERREGGNRKGGREDRERKRAKREKERRRPVDRMCLIHCIVALSQQKTPRTPTNDDDGFDGFVPFNLGLKFIQV